MLWTTGGQHISNALGRDFVFLERLLYAGLFRSNGTFNASFMFVVGQLGRMYQKRIDGKA